MDNFPAHFHDGQTAARHDVAVALAAGGLHIAADDGRFLHLWRYEDLRTSERPRVNAPLRLSTAATPDARLVVDSANFYDGLRHRAPALFARGLDRPAVRRRWVIGLACVAVAAVALWKGVPVLATSLAPLVPAEWVRGWGEALSAQITGDARQCEDPDGLQALQQMTDRLLADAGSTLPTTVVVIDHKMANAFAAPGGNVVILRGLIDEAETADEVAGVLAHELGHAVKRHPTQALIRYAGVSLLLGLIGGDSNIIVETVAEVGGLALLLSYNRDMEREADIFAYDLLQRTNIGADGLISFFERLSDETGEADDPLSTYLSTHPSTRERIAALRQAYVNLPSPRPALDQDAWQALRSICR